MLNVKNGELEAVLGLRASVDQKGLNQWPKWLSHWKSATLPKSGFRILIGADNVAKLLSWNDIGAGEIWVDEQK